MVKPPTVAAVAPEQRRPNAEGPLLGTTATISPEDPPPSRRGGDRVMPRMAAKLLTVASVAATQRAARIHLQLSESLWRQRLVILH